MTRSTLMCAVLACTATIACAAASTKVTAPATNDPTFAPEQLKEDLTVLRAALEEGHPGLYWYSSAPQINEAFASIGRSLSRPMSNAEFYRHVAALSAVIRDGHTDFNLSSALRRQVEEIWPALPFKVVMLGSQLYVLRDYATENQRWAGAEILEIDGHPAGEALATLLALQPRDGNVTTRARWLLNREFRFNTMYATLRSAHGNFDLKLLPRGESEPVRVSLAGVQLTQLRAMAAKRHPADVRHLPPIGNLRFLASGTALLRIGQFANFPDGTSMEEFLAKSFAEIKRRGATALIIDVRDNGGGWDRHGKTLLAHLLHAPFDYYRAVYVKKRHFEFTRFADTPNPLAGYDFVADGQGRLSFAKHSNLGIQQPEEPRFGGRVIVLLNGGSFSTTSEFVAMARHYKVATLVGEEAGGAAGVNTAGVSARVILPNSRLEIEVPLFRYEVELAGDPDLPPDRGALPHLQIAETIEDRLAGRDRTLEEAFKFIP